MGSELGPQLQFQSPPPQGDELQPAGCGSALHSPAQWCLCDMPSQVSSWRSGGCRLGHDTGFLSAALAGFSGRAGSAAATQAQEGKPQMIAGPSTWEPGTWGPDRAISTGPVGTAPMGADRAQQRSGARGHPLGQAPCLLLPGLSHAARAWGLLGACIYHPLAV